MTHPDQALPSLDDADALSAARAWLVRLVPPARADWLIPLSGQPRWIGSASQQDEASTPTPGETLRIELQGETWTVSDAADMAGRGRVRVLTSGERISLGDALFKFLLADDPEAVHLAALFAQSQRDPLTGVYARGYFLEVLNRQLARVLRHGRPLSLVLIDLDNFKQVNDRFGHLTGDRALRRIAERLSGSIRRDELLCRLGGDEFAVLLNEATARQAVSFALRILRRLAEPVDLDGNSLCLTASFGVACCSGDTAQRPADLLELADRKLYDAKRRGGNQIAW
jgi:diguanylate cyclase (GGDEF)-like protein